MPTFRVEVREVWVQSYRVEASSAEEASALVNTQGFGDKGEKFELAAVEGEFEYSHTLGPETWTTEPWEDRGEDED